MTQDRRKRKERRQREEEADEAAEEAASGGEAAREGAAREKGRRRAREDDSDDADADAEDEARRRRRRERKEQERKRAEGGKDEAKARKAPKPKARPARGDDDEDAPSASGDSGEQVPLASGEEGASSFDLDSEVSSVGGGKSVSNLSRELSSSNPRKREAAAHFLGKLGAKAAPAAAKLGELLSDPEENVRLRAARTLGLIGPDAHEATAALVGALSDGDKDRSRDDKSLAGVAARALKRIGAAAWPGLLAALRDRALRRRAARVLRSIAPDPSSAPTLAAIDELLSPGREKAAQAALTALERHGAPGVPLVLRVAAADDEEALQERALETLLTIGKDAAKPLAAALDDDDAALRLAAARALALLAAKVSQKAVARVTEELSEALLDEDVGVRTHVVEALAALEDYPQRVEGLLIQALGDEDPRVSLAAVMGILDVSPDKQALAARMQEVVAAGKQDFVRVGACMVLMHLGQEARDAVPALVQAIEDPSTEVREYAHLALQSIRTPSMRVEVIRTASLRLQVLDESEDADQGEEEQPRRDKRPGLRKRAPGAPPRARRVRRRR
ncbi:MAG: HEAT repeat domain-containing protein [Planctomycetota bacterium]